MINSEDGKESESDSSFDAEISKPKLNPSKIKKIIFLEELFSEDQKNPQDYSEETVNHISKEINSFTTDSLPTECYSLEPDYKMG